MYPRVFDHAYVPTTIACGSLPVKPDETVTDWLYALAWMRNNESVKVVASWWDYGYWITVIGNKTTLSDNGTLNSTQIACVAKMFMSNETAAVKFLKDYDVTHVAVFITFDTSGNDLGWGEESKWRWMARISEGMTNRSDNAYGNHTLGTDWFDSNKDGQRATDGSEDISNNLGKSTIIYKMFQYIKSDLKSLGGISSWTEEITAESKGVFDQYFRLVYSSIRDSKTSYGGVYGVIGVFEVI